MTVPVYVSPIAAAHHATEWLVDKACSALMALALLAAPIVKPGAWKYLQTSLAFRAVLLLGFVVALATGMDLYLGGVLSNLALAWVISAFLCLVLALGPLPWNRITCELDVVAPPVSVPQTSRDPGTLLRPPSR